MEDKPDVLHKKNGRIAELTDLVQSLEGLNSTQRYNTKKTERASELIKKLAEENNYEFKRNQGTGPLYKVYAKRIGERCDVLVDCSGKIAYTELSLKKYLKHRKDVYKVIPQKKEIKKFSRTFWAVEENFYLGSVMSERLVAYGMLIGTGVLAGAVGGLLSQPHSGGLPINRYMFLFAGATLPLTLTIAGLNYLFHERKVKKTFEKYDPKISYNKEAIKKAFG